MKKYIIFIASAVLMMTACAKEEINTTITGETEFISVELSPVTKTQLNGKVTDWTPGDEVSVTVGGKKLGSLKLVDGNVFEGEIEAGHDGEATINYPADVTTVPATQAAVAGSFAEEAALLEGTTTLDELRKGNGPELQNKTALLQFSVAQAGDVTFEVGSTKYTVTGCKTGEIYYACVEPATAKLTARIGGYLSKATSASKTFTAGKIANLDKLPAPVAPSYALMGIDGDWSTGKVFYKDVDGCYLAKNVTFATSTQFKFRYSDEKGDVWARPITFEKGRWAYTYNFPNDNMSSINGTYDVWADPTNDAVCFVDVDGAKPAFTNENKLVHILYEATGNCGLYIKSPSTTVNGYNNTGAWGNFQTVYMNKTSSAAQNYCAFPLPSNVVGKNATFTIRVWGDKNKTYTMNITDDTPFWGNSDNGGYYTLSSRIDIK